MLKTVYCVSNTLSETALQSLRAFSVPQGDSLSICRTFRSQAPLYLSIEEPSLSEKDRELLQSSELSYLFHLPFVIYGECFGVLTLQKADGNLVQSEEQEKIARFTDLVAGAVYNSILYRDSLVAKEEAEKAYKDLQETQAQLIEAERLASLGQLVGGIAHEINNPIGVIHSQAEILKSSTNTSLKQIPRFLESLSPSEKELFYEMVDTSLKSTKSFSTKEERARKKEILKEIESLVPEAEEAHLSLTEEILLLKLPSPYTRYVEELGVPRFQEFLTHAMIFKNQSNSLSNIEIAVEKASRVVFALRSYLNTELSSSSKEVNLVGEVDKALHVYDNYVMGKINVLKDVPSELKYTCVSENLSQVWKNIFFNAIQAMYATDKKLEIRIEKREKLLEDWKSYRTSSIVEDSLFQKQPAGGWVIVSITDSGVGIPAELQEKVFTPFFTTKSLGEGIGLGLYVTKKIVHDHGGALFFQSAEGKTEFLVVLPILQED